MLIAIKLVRAEYRINISEVMKMIKIAKNNLFSNIV